MALGSTFLRLAMASAVFVSCKGATDWNERNSQVRRTKFSQSPESSSGDSTNAGPTNGSGGDKSERSFNDESFESMVDTESKSPAPSMIQQDFPVTSVEDGEVSFEFRRDALEQTIKLTNRYEARKQTFNQADRPSYSKAFQQGNSGQAVTEEFTQNAMGILDLVVVIDNSGSMSQEQANLSTKLAPLLQYVQGSDWKINIVTTDPANGCTRGGVINKNDANATSAFQSAVNAGTGGSGNERGILQAVNALRCNQVMGFPRPKSSIAVLIVADEDNCSSNGNGCGNDPWNTPSYLTDYLRNTLGRVLGTETRIYGIFWHPNTPRTSCSTGENQAIQYAQAVAATSGVYGTICDADYSTTLRQISQDMATILKSEFNLAMTPDPGSVVVKLNGVQVNNGWTLTGKTLTFSDLPPASAMIQVNYTTGMRPILTRFALDQAPAPATLVVKVNGTVAAPNTYSIDSSTNELVFAMPPAESSTITANFRGNTSLLTEFDLVADIRPGSIVVQVNGVKTNEFVVTPNAKLKFMQAPPDAAKIDADYMILVGKLLAYPIAFVGEMIEDVSVWDKASGAPIVASYAEGVVTIDASEHMEGREIIVRYKNETSKIKIVELPYEPVPDSVVLENAPDTCSKSYSLQGDKIRFECGENSDGEIIVSYRYEKEADVSFTLEGVPDPEVGVWSVSIAGVAITEYERNGSTITLTEEPDREAIVRIVWKKD